MGRITAPGRAMPSKKWGRIAFNDIYRSGKTNYTVYTGRTLRSEARSPRRVKSICRVQRLLTDFRLIGKVYIVKNMHIISNRFTGHRIGLRVLCHMLAAALFLSGIFSPEILTRAASEDSATYHVRTKWYERFSDSGHAIVKFAKIVGTGNEKAYANINYILEREAFRVAGEFVYPYRHDNILQAIAALQNQTLYVSYEVLYQDDRLLSVKIEGESTHYTEEGEICFTPEDEWYLLFDVCTGQQLSLSDFIEVDMRIVDYRAEDYKTPDYARPTQIEYYSFKDAFWVYEDEPYEEHREMNADEALEMLKNEELGWAVTADKDLLLYNYFSSSEISIRIPYSYIADFAHY